jgi:hypothetical protein
MIRILRLPGIRRSIHFDEKEILYDLVKVICERLVWISLHAPLILPLKF